MSRKVITILLALMMVLSVVMSGCSNSDTGKTTDAATTAAATSAAESAASTSAAASSSAAGTGDLDAVTLVWYNASDAFRSDKAQVKLDVADELNRIFQEKINATVDWKWVGWSEVAEKTAAAIQAGQQADILFTSMSTFPFAVWQSRNAFADLTDLLPTYAAETYSSIPEWVWKAASVGGRIYAMPTYKDVAVNHPLHYNLTMTNELGLTETVDSVDFSVLPDLNELFYTVKEARDAKMTEWANEPIMKLPNYSDGITLSPYIQGDEICRGVWTSIPGTTSLTGDEYANGTKAVNIFNTEDYITGMKLNTQWVTDGIAPFDQKNWDTEGAIQKSGAVFGTIGWGGITPSAHDAYEEALVQPKTSFTYTGYPQAVMQAISASSANPERAMMLLNLVFSDTTVSTTLRFGIEGQGWKRVTDANGVERADFTGTYNEVPGERSENGFYLWYHAEQGNLFSCLLPVTEPDEFYVKLAEMNDSAAVSPNLGFCFDSANVENEMAAVSATVEEYQPDIFYGMLDDVEGRIADFNEKLNANGMEKIVAEVQTQLDAWRANNG